MQKLSILELKYKLICIELYSVSKMNNMRILYQFLTSYNNDQKTPDRNFRVPPFISMRQHRIRIH